MRNMKRFLTGLLACALIFGSVDAQAQNKKKSSSKSKTKTTATTKKKSKMY